MKRPSSYSVAPGDHARQSVLTKGALIGVVVMALTGLALVYPKNALLTYLKRDTEASDRELTITYLRNLIRSETKDVSLRLLLAEKLIDAKEFAEAEINLIEASRLATERAQHVRIGEIDTELAWSRFREARERLALLKNEAAMDAADGRHRGARSDAVMLESRIAMLQSELEKAKKILEAKLRLAIEQFTGSQTAFDLLDQASDVGVPSLQQDILKRMRGQNLPIEDLVKLARTARALSEFQLSSDFYLTAKSKSTEPAERRNLILQGVNSLLAMGDSRRAYEMAKRELQGADSPPQGDPLWWQIAGWALAAGVPRDAAQHLQRVIPADWNAQQLAKNLKPEQLSWALDAALAGANLPDAMRFAQAGLVQNPGDAKLRERYAQVLEWGGKPQEALTQWLAIMQRGASERATAQVLRLAPMLYDDDALLAAWLMTSKKRPLSLDEIKRVIEVYERVGQPAQALAFLDQLSVAQGQLKDNIQVLQAFVLERMGRSAEAVASLEGLRHRLGALSRDDAMRLASLYLRKADFKSALLALMSHTPPVGGNWDAEYWSLRADLAYESHQPDVTRDALARLYAQSLKSGKLELSDPQLERLLRDAVDRGQFPQAIEYARKLYPLVQAKRDAQSSDRLMTVWLNALGAWAQAKHELATSADRAVIRSALTQWIAALTPAQARQMSANPLWLNQRASIYAMLGEKKLAAADYRASLAVSQDSHIRAAYWWLLMDMSDSHALRGELAKLSPDMRTDPVLLEVQAVAWQFLGEWQKALAFYRLQTKDPAKAKDALWLASYADVLEQAGEASLALRVRRKSFDLLGQAMSRLSDLKKREAAEALLLRLRLSEGFSSGAEKERLQKLLGYAVQDDGLASDLGKQARELVVYWALGASNGSGPNGSRNELARRWFWMQQARKLGTEDPKSRINAELAIALAEEDLPALDRLLAQSEGQLQPQDRLNILRQLARSNPQRLAEAVSLATDLAQKGGESPRGDESHQALQDDLRKMASSVRAGLVSHQGEILRTQGTEVEADIAVSPRLRVLANVQRLRHETANPLQFVLPSQGDLELGIGARLMIPNGEIKGAVTRRKAFESVTGMHLNLAQKIDARNYVGASLEIRQRSTASDALTVAGMQDRVAINVTHLVAKDIGLGVDASLTRYKTQAGTALGQAKSFGVNGTWHLRKEYPDIGLRAALSRQRTRASGTPDAHLAVLDPDAQVPASSMFVPQSATTMNLRLGYGLTQSINSKGAYSNAVRPYGEIGVDKSWGSGAQTLGLLNVGLRSTITGRDQLAVGVQIKPVIQSNNPNAKSVRELRVQYEWLTDR